jgi:hypothetical protein
MEKLSRFALMFMLSLVIAGCGGSSKNARACASTTGVSCTTNSSFVGRTPMPDSPYALRL